MALRRRRSTILYFIVWSAYLMADSVAISALSLIASENVQPNEIGGDTKLPNLVAFWSPFLLLHLGGPDAITALNIEDNKLSWRHLLGLIVQTSITAFALIKSFHPHSSPPSLLILSIFIFLAGFFKYLERILSLMFASSVEIWDYQYEGAQWRTRSLPSQVQSRYNITYDAHYYLQIFKHIFVNLSVDQESHKKSKDLFRKKEWKVVFKVIEIQLQLMFESLYTKPLPHLAKRRFTLKVFSFCLIFTTLIVFMFINRISDVGVDSVHYQIFRTDIAITYILLGGALVLEIFHAFLLLLNDWTFMMLMFREKLRIQHNRFLELVRGSQLDILKEPPRWSNTLGQCNMVRICLRSTDVKPHKWLLWVRDMLEKFWRMVAPHNRPIDDKLKEVIVEHLWARVGTWEAEVKRIENLNLLQKGIYTEDLFRAFVNRRGDWLLEKHKCQEKYGWTTALRIYHSIILWHIATDICYYQHCAAGSCSSTSNNPRSRNRSLSKDLSNHLMYLLHEHTTIVTSKMIPKKWSKEFCCALRKELIKDPIRCIENESQACENLYENSKGHHHPEENIDLYKLKKQPTSNISVIQDACDLSKDLMSENPEKRWEIIIGMWLEMLVYVANQCPRDFHAKRLAHGGELITHVWLLMTQLGISTSCEPATTVDTEEASTSHV